MWRKTVLETTADVAQNFVLGASPVKLRSRGWREMIAFVKYASDAPKNIRREMQVWIFVIERITEN